MAQSDLDSVGFINQSPVTSSQKCLFGHRKCIFCHFGQENPRAARTKSRRIKCRLVYVDVGMVVDSEKLSRELFGLSAALMQSVHSSMC